MMKKVLLVLLVLLCMTSMILAYDYFPGRNVNMEGKWNITNSSFVDTKCLKLNGTTVCNPAALGNYSWNQTLANSLYINKSSEPNLNVNSSTWWAGINAIGSILGSVINNDLGWLTWTQITPHFYFKNQTYNTSIIDYNISLRLLSTDQRYNETGVIQSSNASWLSTYNSTYDSKVSFPGYTNVALTNQSNIFNANQNLSNYNLTSVSCIKFISGGMICSLP